MYVCKSWTMKKAECWWIDAFELWCWRRQDLESPLDYRKNKLVHSKGNQSWISVGRTDTEAETPILWPPDVENWLTGCWEEKEGDDRGWDGWMASPTPWTWVWVNSGSWWWTGRPGHAAIHGVAKNRTRLSDWTELRVYMLILTS